LLFGALVFKPHLALLIPAALLAGGHWKAIAGAVISSLGLLLLALLVFGPGAYLAFLHNSAADVGILRDGTVGWAKIQSLFGAVRQLGAPAWLAIALQAASGLAALIFVVRVWRSSADTLTQAATLAAGALIATPYALDYDLVLLILPICWWARRGLAGGFADWERLGLACLYAAPLLSRQLSAALGINLVEVFLLSLFVVFAAHVLKTPTSALGLGKPDA
jgi:hypothetical protein